jgi:hypothetical protein
MEVKKVKLSALKLNDGNPRIIKDFKFHQLVKSLLTFPEMLRLREVVCDETMLILGGNMRCRALMHIAQMTEQELKQELKKIDRDEYTDQWMRWHDCPMIDVKIAEGLSDEQKKNVISIVNRKEAIRTACALAQKGDVILVAGKGHEDYQDVKGVKHHFDDKEIIREIFNA